MRCLKKETYENKFINHIYINSSGIEIKMARFESNEKYIYTFISFNFLFSSSVEKCGNLNLGNWRCLKSEENDTLGEWI